MIGTVMAANVFFVIIPAHWELIRAKEAGREPDPAPALQAKQRSVHNNYLTLPVVLTMLAGHFPFAYGADHAWLVLVGLMVIGAWARLFFNLRHAGRTHWWMPVAGAAAFVALAVLVDRADDTARPRRRPPTSRSASRCSSPRAARAATRSPTPARPARSGPSLDAAQPSAVARRRARARREGRRCRRSPGKLSDAEIDAVAAYVSGAAAARIGAACSGSAQADSSSSPASRRRPRPRRSPRSDGCFRSSRGSSTSAGRARRAGSRSATSTSGSAPRTRPATRSPGEIVLYPGGVSETEILLAYGYVSFASKAGALAGNHFATIVEGNENLRELGGSSSGRAPRTSRLPRGESA